MPHLDKERSCRCRVLVMVTSAVSSSWKWSKHNLLLALLERASDTHIYPGDPDFLLYKPLCKANKGWRSLYVKKGEALLKSCDSTGYLTPGTKCLFKRRVVTDPRIQGREGWTGAKSSQKPVSPFHRSLQSEKEASKEHDRWLQNQKGCLTEGTDIVHVF